MEGRTLGKYRIVEQIGLGGMATVYKAYDPPFDRYVALKVLPEQYSQDPSFQERFRREAQAIARLQHLHILPVYDFDEQGGTTYLAMRLLETGTLADRIKQGPLPLDEASHLLRQIATALDYAHNQGIIHRDIKPSNVLLDEDGNAYLTDFGIAKMIEGPSLGLTGTSLIIGTPEYMSPEQCNSVKNLTPASDIYSLGIVLYEMVTGRVPFQAETLLALLNMHVHDALPLPRSLRPELTDAMQAVVFKALAKEPGSRYRSCIEMAKAFARAVSEYEHQRREDEEAERKTVIVEKDMPPPPRFPIWAIAGVIGVVIVGVIAGIATGIIPIGGATPAPTAVPSATAPPTVTVAPTLSAEEWVAQGRREAEAGNHQAAIDAYTQAIALNPTSATYYALGDSHAAVGNLDAAIEDFTNAIRLDPTSPFPYRRRGDMYFELESFLEALADYQSYLRLGSEDDPAVVERVAELEATLGVTAIVGVQGGIVRTAPALDADPLGTLAAGQQIGITGISPDRVYYRVDYNGQVGWVSTSFIREVQGDPISLPVIVVQIATMGVQGGIIRIAPALDADALGTIAAEQQIVVTGISPDGDYYRLDYNGQVGWVSTSFIRDIDGTPSTVPVPVIGTFNSVLGGVVRSLPTSNAEVLGFLTEDIHLPITGISPDGEFYRVDFNGEAGWIDRVYVVEVQGDPSSLPVVTP